MPLIQLDTSVCLPDEARKQAIAKMLSQIAAEETGKPEQYVMSGLRDNVSMTMSGAPGPCALVAVKAIGGLGKSVNRSLAASVTRLLQKELGIAPDRIYVTFEELSPSNWAWEGRVFG